MPTFAPVFKFSATTSPLAGGTAARQGSAASEFPHMAKVHEELGRPWIQGGQERIQYVDAVAGYATVQALRDESRSDGAIPEMEVAQDAFRMGAKRRLMHVLPPDDYARVWLGTRLHSLARTWCTSPAPKGVDRVPHVIDALVLAAGVLCGVRVPDNFPGVATRLVAPVLQDISHALDCFETHYDIPEIPTEEQLPTQLIAALASCVDDRTREVKWGERFVYVDHYDGRMDRRTRVQWDEVVEPRPARKYDRRQRKWVEIGRMTRVEEGHAVPVEVTSAALGYALAGVSHEAIEQVAGILDGVSRSRTGIRRHSPGFPVEAARGVSSLLRSFMNPSEPESRGTREETEAELFTRRTFLGAERRAQNSGAVHEVDYDSPECVQYTADSSERPVVDKVPYMLGRLFVTLGVNLIKYSEANLSSRDVSNMQNVIEFLFIIAYELLMSLEEPDTQSVQMIVQAQERMRTSEQRAYARENRQRIDRLESRVTDLSEALAALAGRFDLAEEYLRDQARQYVAGNINPNPDFESRQERDRKLGIAFRLAFSDLDADQPVTDTDIIRLFNMSGYPYAALRGVPSWRLSEPRWSYIIDADARFRGHDETTLRGILHYFE